MPIYDFKCEKCNIKGEYIETREDSEKDHFCPVCDSVMIRLFPNKTVFKLVYNNQTDKCDWNGNTSMFWNDVKKAKAEGKNVKGAHEK